jgi:hypothetical protein
VSTLAQIRLEIQGSMDSSAGVTTMTQQVGDGDWRSIAEQTSKEMDPARLTILVARLCLALDAKREEKFSGSAKCFAAD